MSKLTLVSLTVAILAIFSSSCKKNPADSKENYQGQLTISISASQLKNALELVTDSNVSTGITAVVVTIQDLDSKDIKSSEKIELYNMNGYYISKPISLHTGGYKLTQFLVLNGKNEVVYAAPLKSSPKAYLVTTPLPISFTVEKDVVTKIIPEVVSTTGSKPEDFGYGSFSFEVAETFDFLVGTFVYNDSNKNFELTTANIKILNDTSLVYEGALKANPVTTTSLSNYDSLGITNKITLPERYTTYTIEISKQGYKAYRDTFTKEELRLYNRSEDKGPLVVILEKGSSLSYGLVAYYKLNGDALDYSGYNNHGILNGAIPANNRHNNPNSAYSFDGINDYVWVGNSVRPNKIAYSLWFLSNSTKDNLCIIRYRSFGFSVGLNNNYRTLTSKFAAICYINATEVYVYETQKNYCDNKWHHLVISYDGNFYKAYIDKIEVYASNVLGFSSIYYGLGYSDGLALGRDGDNSDFYFEGSLDDVRIYNRALSQEEITELYNE
jgi:hypothetical protein